MRNAFAIIVYYGFAVQKLCAGGATGSIDRPDKLLDRVAKESFASRAGLDATTLGKDAPSSPTVEKSSEDLKDQWSRWMKKATAADDRPKPQDTSEPDRLLAKKGRSVADCEKAANLYRNMLKAVDPKSAEATSLRISAADAMNAAMRISTNGNVVGVEETQDNPANKRMWSKFGPEAKALSKAAFEAAPKDARACGVFADAAQYEGSTKGLVKQALTGGGKEFIKNAKALQKFPQEEAALGLCLEGAFYLVAPWPLKNHQKAVSLLKDATKVSSSRRNLYYLGLAHYRSGEMELAKQAWQKSMAAQPGSKNEADVANYIASQAKLGIKRVEEKAKAQA